MTLERAALDKLLLAFPDYDVLSVDWQLPDATRSFSGPWVLVTLGQRSEDNAEAWARRTYAVWKSTGAVHGIDSDGAVIDPPLLVL